MPREQGDAMDKDVRALTIRQPYARLIATGEKRYETRSWMTDWTGPLLIHAGLYLPGKDYLDEDVYPRGAVVGVAWVTSVRPTQFYQPEGLDPRELELGDWGPNMWAWALESPQGIPEPIRWGGRQGLWRPPAELLERVREQVRI